MGEHLETKADVATLWTGVSDVMNEDDPRTRQERLRALLGRLKADVARLIVVIDQPDLARLLRFRMSPIRRSRWRNSFNAAMGKHHQAADDVPSEDASSVMRWADKGAAISSSDRPSALTPSASSTTAPTIINPAPSK